MPGNKKQYYERKSAGLCVVCGLPSDGHLYCKSCHEKEKESRRRRMSDVTGRFCECGNPAYRMIRPNEGICERCDRIERRIYNKVQITEGRRPNLLSLNPMPA